MQGSKGWEPSGADGGGALGKAAWKTLPITSDLLPHTIRTPKLG